MTHDYKRNGTTTLFAALNTLDGTVVGRCLPKHTHKGYIREHNRASKPFVWTKPAEDILEKLSRLPEPSE